ncbi:NIPSNAP family protein [Bordetella petrii]|nr:NIPSNAP family protein [Bordetella petrii]
MIYELKKYTANPGKAEALRERFAACTMPIFKRLGIEVVHCWTEPGAPNDFYYVTRFPSAEARDAALKAFGADPEWKAAKAASETDGPLLGSQTTVALVPTEFSPND